MSDTIPELTIERIRHELKRRPLTLLSKEELTPHMLRLTFEGEDLADFASPGVDDHVKLIFPVAGEEKPVMREYTPRSYDTAARRLVLDFAVHEAGPATAWAIAAQPGDELTVGGPRGSQVLSGPQEWLLIGDETALPAIARRIEGLDAGHKVTALITVPGAADEQSFDSDAQVEIRWIHRPEDQAHLVDPILPALAEVELSAGLYAWIAAEASVARALRDALQERGHPLTRMKAAGYWTRGVADGSDKGIA
ncbi:siderophore-interacting protein [Pseudooceanicola sp. 200-1SW]|uniref:siderophore-interacting protein n=1 Tax=Pseudooceanicola sp. 200-1SW TaxID=3425949 RepID=UPI003D7F8CCD